MVRHKKKDNTLLWRIHSWMGLYAGVMIAFLSLTGAAALFRIEIDHALNPSLRSTESTGQWISIDSVVKKEAAKHPDKLLFEIELPKKRNGTLNIRFFPKERETLFPVLWEVFVDPFTGKKLGERNYYKTFNYYLRNIHVRFYEGYFGRQIVGLAGIALLISTITGILIYGKFMKNRFFASIRKKNLRVSQADWHKLIGITALLFNLMISITGAWLGLQTYLQKGLGIERPNVYQPAEKPFSKEEDRALAVHFDEVHTRIGKEFPVMVPTLIRPSTDGRGVVEVMGDVIGRTYERNSNKLVFDKIDHSLLFKFNISESSLGSKLFFVQEAFHFGDFGGMFLKVFYCFMGLTSGFLALSGYIVYLKRNEKKRHSHPKFVALKPLLLQWTVGILGFCILICFLSITFGIGIPTLIVIVAFYGFLLVLVTKALLLFVKKKIRSYGN